MKYVSTRGEAPPLGFSGALMAGLAADGGLYLPESWPEFSADDIRALRGQPYAEVAYRLIAPFVGDDIPAARLREMVDEAYATFRHPAVAPLVQTGTDTFLLELFHGPTLAFKDVAMQLLARLMDHVLGESGARATIIGATSGDTGGAAVEAFGGRDNTDIFILFPAGRVSPVQQRQMTSSGHDNVHALAVEGDFDDCQALVKSLFADPRFREAAGLSGVNSINWARIVAQIVYYFTAAVSLGAPDRPVRFTVPTGNFGDIFAGYCALRMGLPVEQLVIATNENDILARTLETGRYERRAVVATTSPSMDIQVSSNFERLLFEATGRRAEEVRAAMGSLAQSGTFALDPLVLAQIRSIFSAGRADAAAAAAEIARLQGQSGYVADPHTAVALAVAGGCEPSPTGAPMVVLSTAHPAKFPDAVREACGIDPALPPWLSDLWSREERVTGLAADAETLKQHIRSRSRAFRERQT